MVVGRYNWIGSAVINSINRLKLMYSVLRQDFWFLLKPKVMGADEPIKGEGGLACAVKRKEKLMARLPHLQGEAANIKNA